MKIFIFLLTIAPTISFKPSESDKKKYREQIAKYDNCIVDRNFKVLSGQFNKAFVINVLESVTIKCHTCDRPDAENPEDLIVWKRQLRSQLTYELLNPLIDGIRFHLNDEHNELTVFNIRANDEGHYWCEMYNTLTVINEYYINVLPTDLKIAVYENVTDNILAFPNAFKKYDTISLLKLELIGLKVYVHWNEWSRCSKCGDKETGIRLRYGFCYVQKTRNNVTFAETLDGKLFDYYKGTGVPCQSTLFTYNFRKNHGLNTYKSFTMYGDCKVPCFQMKVFNKNLNEINDTQIVLDTSAIKKLSLHKFTPKKILVATNQIVTVRVGRSIRMRCNANNKIDDDILGTKSKANLEAIAWKFNGSILDMQTLPKQTADRIRIDNITHVLYIRNIKLEDAGVYACFRSDQVISIIKLKVARALIEAILLNEQRQQKDYEKNLTVAFGAVLTLITMLIVSCYSLFSRAQKNKT